MTEGIRPVGEIRLRSAEDPSDGRARARDHDLVGRRLCDGWSSCYDTCRDRPLVSQKPKSIQHSVAP
jgi:hypothetical protein